jgi:hypothetical protein
VRPALLLSVSRPQVVDHLAQVLDLVVGQWRQCRYGRPDRLPVVLAECPRGGGCGLARSHHLLRLVTFAGPCLGGYAASIRDQLTSRRSTTLALGMPRVMLIYPETVITMPRLGGDS